MTPDPLDDTVQPGSLCECQFTPDPTDPDEDTVEKSWHYRRRCGNCDLLWWSLHCPHDRKQSPCPDCGYGLPRISEAHDDLS